MAMTASTFFRLADERRPQRVEDEFFSALKVGNSTFKLTSAGRFAVLDESLIRTIGRFPGRLENVLDVGISSAATTIDLYDRLKRAGHDVRISATDLTIEAYIVPVLPGCRVLVDGQGHVLQYDIFGRALRPWRRRLDLVTGMTFVRRVAHRLLGRRAEELIQAGILTEAEQVQLVSPRVTRHAAITTMQDDILVPNRVFAAKFDLIRAANILNLDYFDHSDLRRALKNVVSYMSGPGAWLLLARTDKRSGEHHATFFRMDRDGRLMVVTRFGAGSEVEAIALNANAAT
jgi:hypothetical protein